MKLAILLFTAILTVGTVGGQNTAELSAKADAHVLSAGIEGTVLLARRGEVLLVKGYGLANREHGVPNKPETKFRLGSITKQFTAAAILQLQGKGKLKVSDSISKYLPSAPAAWSGITIHHLLTHTSGIPSYTDDKAFRERMRERSDSPLTVIRRFRDLPLQFDPGTQFRYNNSGYFLLGVIIEQVAGLPYDEYLRREIFAPLQMSDTGYDRADTILKDRASGYSKKKDSGQMVNAAFLDMGQPYAAGSLYSTVLDLYRWDRALYTSNVLSDSSRAAAFAPISLEWYEGTRYGYGWGISRLKGKKSVGHEGHISGFSTVILRAVEDDAVVIILSNQEGVTSIGKTGRELLEMVVGAS